MLFRPALRDWDIVTFKFLLAAESLHAPDGADASAVYCVDIRLDVTAGVAGLTAVLSFFAKTSTASAGDSIIMDFDKYTPTRVFHNLSPCFTRSACTIFSVALCNSCHRVDILLKTKSKA